MYVVHMVTGIALAVMFGGVVVFVVGLGMVKLLPDMPQILRIPLLLLIVAIPTAAGAYYFGHGRGISDGIDWAREEVFGPQKH